MAYHINSCTIEGNVGRDATVGQTAGGETYTRFSLANTQGEKTEWFSCVMFGEGRAKIAPAIVKGAKLVVVGRVGLDTYTSKEGETMTNLSLNVQAVSLPQRDRNAAATEEEATPSVVADEDDEELNF